MSIAGAAALAGFAFGDAEVRAQETNAAVTELDEISVEGEGAGSAAKVATRGYQPVATSTATGAPTPILEIPQSISVISREALRDQAATSLDDALVNASGVTQANTLGGTQDAFIRRGFGDNRDGSTLTDGLRTALPRSFNATTERVEVLKGPSSALYGILDPGGLVNVITKRPHETFGGSLQAWTTSYGGGEAQFDVTGPIDGSSLSYRLIGSWQDTDYWKNFGSTKRGLINPQIAWRGEDTTIVASYLHEDYRTPFDRGTVFDVTTGKPIDIARRKRLDEPFNVTDGKTDVASLKLEHAFNDAWRLNASYAYSRNVYGDYQARVSAYDPVAGTITRVSDGTQDSTLDVHSGRADLSGDVSFGGLRHQLLFGTNYDYSDVLRTDILRCVGATSPVDDIDDWPSLEKCETPSLPVSDQRERLKTWSAYAQDSVHLTDRLIAIGGLRYQEYETFSGRGRPFVTATDGSGHKVIPRLGGVFKLTPEASLFALWSRSFKPQSSTANEVGALPPEEGESYEAGIKFEAFGGITATASVYQITKKNVVYGSTVLGDLQVSGKVRSRGFETDLAGQLSENVSVIASYGYTDAVNTAGDFDGERPPNVAKHTASFYATYDFGKVRADDELKIGAGVRAQSKRPGITTNTYFLPGYAVVDAFAAYRIAAAYPVTVQLNLKNIFDKTYYASSIGTTAFANSIGEPFQAILTARVDF